jgi:uncharacterized membrane protein YwaF
MNSAFGTKHFILLAISAALVVGLYILSRRISFEKICRILLYTGITSEIIKIFYYISANEETHGGILPKTDLPFHLCSIQIIFIAIINFSKNEKLKRFILSFMFPSCLVGGAAALLLPTASSLNGMWIITAQYFLFHIAIMILALNIATHKDLRLNVGDYFNCLKFLLMIMFFAFYINSMVYDGKSNINFMYVAGPPMSGLPYLNEDHGWLVYIIHYAFLVIFAVTACYASPIIKAIRAKLHSSDQEESNEEVKTEETV